METNSDISTRLEVYKALVDESKFVKTPGIGHLVEKEHWEHIDFLLDTLVMLNAIEVV